MTSEEDLIKTWEEAKDEVVAANINLRTCRSAETAATNRLNNAKTHEEKAWAALEAHREAAREGRL